MEQEPKSGKPKGLIENRTYTELLRLGWEVDGPFYLTAPTPNAKYIEGCAEYAELLEHFLLETVIVKDQFDKDHAARREFEETHPEIEIFNSKYSKLSMNILFRTLISMQEIIEKCGKKYPEKTEELFRIADPDNLGRELNVYRFLEFKDKVDLARRLDDTVYRFLEALSR